MGAYLFQEQNGDGRRGAYVFTESTLGGVHDAEVNLQLGEITEEGVTVPTWGLSGAYDADLSRWLTLQPTAYVGRTLDYGELAPAFEQGYRLATTRRPTPGIRLDLSSTHERFQADGAELETAWRQRGRMRWQFTQAWGLRLVGELLHGNALDTTLLSSVLLRHLPHPGTAFYLGYVERTDVSEAPETLSRTVFAKATWLFRL